MTDGELEKRAFVYMLSCADGTLYTGWTPDIERRLKQHNAGKASKYTRSRLPVELVYLEECADRGAALSRECAIKKLTRAQKMRLAEEYCGSPSKE